ncbi:MAG: N-acetylmuramoyl-L-alanine amidase [Akkermansia sp.]|nr:N-acetylmuramoyl-L-alanine amidase [Akkermansia sp.]
MKRLLLLISALCAMVLISSCSAPRGTADGPVVLDIGHYIGMGGATSPRAVNGKRLQEVSWWYQYAYYTKKVIEDAGYKVYVVNRGNAPAGGPLAAWARRAGVRHLGKPDGGRRYPSEYFPDRVASGIASADYAIYRRASCAVFLHHNSTRGWKRRGGSNSLIICNKHNGGRLASCLAATLNSQVLNNTMPNGGINCRVEVRSVDAGRSAGWMNACDDAGIPAAVVEAAFLNNAAHVRYLSNEANARYYAEAVGRGVVNYLRTLGREPRRYREDTDKPDRGSFGYAAESRRLHVPGAAHLW